MTENKMFCTEERQLFRMLFFGYIIIGLFWGSWGALLPALKITSKTSNSIFGMNLSFISIGALFAMFLFGRIVDKMGQLSLIICFFLFGISVFFIGFFANTNILAIILLFLGISSGFSDVSLNTGVACLEKKTGKPFFNKVQAAFPLGAILASPVVGMLRKSGINIEIILDVIASLMCVFALSSIRPCQTIWQKQVTPVFLKLSIKTSRILFFIGFIGAIVYIFSGAVEQWSAIYIESDLHSSAFMASLGHPVFMTMLFLGRIIMQRIGTYFGAWKIFAIAAFFTAIGMYVTAISLSPQIVLLGFAFSGFGLASGMPTVFSLAGRAANKNKGTGIGFVSTIAYSGTFISPLLIGGLASLVDLRFSWEILSFFSILCLVFIFVWGLLNSR